MVTILQLGPGPKTFLIKGSLFTPNKKRSTSIEVNNFSSTVGVLERGNLGMPNYYYKPEGDVELKGGTAVKIQRLMIFMTYLICESINIILLLMLFITDNLIGTWM